MGMRLAQPDAPSASGENPCRLTNSACEAGAFFAAVRASRLRPLQLVRALSALRGFTRRPPSRRSAIPARPNAYVRGWPRWSRRIPTRIGHGIGHGHARVFMKPIGDKAVIPKERTPHRTPRFRDWAAEETDHPREVIEPALAHDVRNPVDAAYARSDLFERRQRPSYTLYSQRTSLHSGSSAREGPVGDDEDLVALHGLGVAIGRPMPIIRLLAPAADYSSSNRRSAPAGHRKGPGSRRATGS